MPLQQTFHPPPLFYASTLSDQRQINMPLVTQSLWEPREANSAQYGSYGIISLISRPDHSNPSSSIAVASHSPFRIFATTFVHSSSILDFPLKNTTLTAYGSVQQLQLQLQRYRLSQSNNLDGGAVRHTDHIYDQWETSLRLSPSWLSTVYQLSMNMWLVELLYMHTCTANYIVLVLMSFTICYRLCNPFYIWWSSWSTRWISQSQLKQLAYLGVNLGGTLVWPHPK